MIVFDLRCRDGGEIFEGWFSSGADFDEQLARGLVQCPLCGGASVEKAPMAPRLKRSGPMAQEAAAMSALAALQAKLIEGSEWVGEELPDKARAMHLGEIERKAVHGQASAEEARALIEEGVPVLPLPLPVTSPGQVN